MMTEPALPVYLRVHSRITSRIRKREARICVAREFTVRIRVDQRNCLAITFDKLTTDEAARALTQAEFIEKLLKQRATLSHASGASKR